MNMNNMPPMITISLQEYEQMKKEIEQARHTKEKSKTETEQRKLKTLYTIDKREAERIFKEIDEDESIKTDKQIRKAVTNAIKTMKIYVSRQKVRELIQQQDEDIKSLTAEELKEIVIEFTE